MLTPQPNSENKAQVEQVEPSPIWGRVCMMLKAPTDSALEESDQDDPKNVDAIERLRAKFARLDKEAERLAETMRPKQKKN